MTADSHMDRSLSARVADIRGRLDADSPGAADCVRNSDIAQFQTA